MYCIEHVTIYGIATTHRILKPQYIVYRAYHTWPSKQNSIYISVASRLVSSVKLGEFIEKQYEETVSWIFTCDLLH